MEKACHFFRENGLLESREIVDIAEGQLILSTMLMCVNFILMAILWTEFIPLKIYMLKP